MSPHRLQAALWLGLGLVFLWLLYLLSPILAPFLLAAVLAYVCDPLVEKLARRRVPRGAGVVLVMTLLFGVLTGLLLILLPLIRDESTLLAQRLPEAVDLFNDKLTPWLEQRFGVHIRLDTALLGQLFADHGDSLQSLAAHLFQSMKIGGLAVFGVIANLLLAPVVMYYLLRDWDQLTRRIANVVPRPWRDKTYALLGAVDAVLAEYLRGQILVMLLLAVYYSLGLWLAGVDFALSVGVLTGLLIFIPYLGYATGFALALLVAVLQGGGIAPLLGVLTVFGIGQLLESFLLTPYLVGERIGLHPLAAIFALLAFGQLFGFAGILVALPASAALLVGLRELRTAYLASPFYRGQV
jgi:predicted PurR-regulated permease PerM